MDNPFSHIGETDIDATLMEGWLSGVTLSELSPKVLYDLQTLLRHYKDIIVPDKNVDVQYPTDEDVNYCASVHEGKVFIPTQHLAKGKIDTTIAGMIHELHHIKLSDSEIETWMACFEMLMTCLKTIFVEDGEGGYNSLYDIVVTRDVTFQNLYIDKENKSVPYLEYIRKMTADIALLLNAYEDVRIDELTQPNLKKYLDKTFEGEKENFVSLYDAGEFSNNDALLNVTAKVLFHHKGAINDSYIKSKGILTSDIVGMTPKEYIPIVFEKFADEIRNHVENSFENEDGNSENPSTGNDLMDRYFEQSGSDDADDRILGESGQGSEGYCKGIQFEDREYGETEMKPNSVQANEYHKDKERSEIKPPILPQDMVLEIESYKNLKIHTSTEQVSSKEGAEVTFSCAIFDDLA